MKWYYSELVKLCRMSAISSAETILGHQNILRGNLYADKFHGNKVLQCEESLLNLKGHFGDFFFSGRNLRIALREFFSKENASNVGFAVKAFIYYVSLQYQKLY